MVQKERTAADTQQEGVPVAAAGRQRVRVGRLLEVSVLLFCFGLLGLLWLLPTWRRRRARRAVTTRHRLRTAAVVVFAVLLAVGAAARVHAGLRPPELCHSRITPSGQVTPEPLLPAASAGSPTWNAVRRAVVAPTSGLALLASRAAGMHQCSGPPFTVTFSWPSTVSGGSAVGDTFVTWIPSDRPARDVHRRIRGTGLSGETPFVRFGPNMSTNQMAEERLARHETRHLDQWAVFSLAGGPLAFPLAYWGDSLLFPASRSHFERDAGLANGGYAEPSDYGPAPLRGPLTGVVAAALVAARDRLRRLARAAGSWRGSAPTSTSPRGPVRTGAKAGVWCDLRPFIGRIWQSEHEHRGAYATADPGSAGGARGPQPARRRLGLLLASRRRTQPG